MPTLELLGTADCQLCDEAEALLFDVLQAQGLRARRIDITEGDASDELIARYGLRIPVLRLQPFVRESSDFCGDELSWPFSADQVKYFLASHQLI